MQELTFEQVEVVSGGVAPLAIIALDLAFQGVWIAGLALISQK